MPLDLPPKLWLPPKPAIIRPAQEMRRASFLPGMFPAGVAAGGTPAEVAYVATGVNTSSPGNTYNFSDRSFGDEHPSRQIIVLVHGSNANLVVDQNYTTSVSVGGVAATRKVAPTTSVNTHRTAWITPRMDNGGPSGTSGTIQIRRSTGNGFTSGMAFVAFAAYNLKNEGEPHDSILMAGTLALPGGGILTAMAFHGEASTVFDWDGAEEAGSFSGGVGSGDAWSAALLNKTSANSSHSVNPGAGSLIAVSWR